MSLRMLDLCAGLGGASQAMRERGWFVVTLDLEPVFRYCLDGNKPVEGPNGYVWHEYPGEDSERCTAQPIRDERDALRVAIAGRAYMGRSNADWVAIAERMRANETTVLPASASEPESVTPEEAKP